MTRSLWDVLGAIADRRGRKGRQFPLQAVLAIAIAAMLAGANDLRAIFRWGRRLKPEALALFGIERAPCHATYHYVFRSLDGDALARALGSFACGRDAPGHIAIDGKTLRGSRRLDAKALHVVSAFATQLSAVVGDLAVAPDENEITAALALLKELPLEGANRYRRRDLLPARNLSNDHGRTRRLCVRGERQPARAESRHSPRASAIFPPSRTGDASSAPPPDLAAARTIEKSHGRIETRSIAVSAEVVPHLAWPGAAQVARIERERRIGNKVSAEVAYLVTSLTAAQAGPERLLDLARAHWGIENQLHYVRDVSMDEDRCRVRAGARPLATSRNLVLNLIRSRGLPVREARENFREDRADTIALVTGRIL
jgi:predicted transposase YbfD/YdcC